MIDFSVQPLFITMQGQSTLYIHIYALLMATDPTESRVIPPKVIGLLLPPLLRAPQPVNKDRLLT